MACYIKPMMLALLASGIIAQLTGGWNAQSSDPAALDEDLKLFIQNELKGQGIFGEKESWSIKRIIRHDTQVVAGINHILLLQMIEHSGRIKIISLRVFQKLPFEKSRFEISELRDLQLNDFNKEDISNDPELLRNLQKTVLRVHEYKSQGTVRYQLKKFNYAAAYKNEGIYNLNYLLEGTNNEIALYEHWLTLSNSNNNIRNSIYLVKLDLGASRGVSWGGTQTTETCETVVSYLVCLRKEEDCSAEAFESQIKCSSIKGKN